MRYLLAIFMLLLAPAIHAQQLGYQDADTPSEAIGMMNTTLVSSRKLLAECTARFPAFEQEMYENYRKWEEAERPAITKTRYFYTRMARRDSKLLEMNEYVETSIVKVVEGLANAPSPHAAEVLCQYCRKQFADFASGIWRSQRTPKAYKFLDDAPPPPSTEK